MYSHYNSVFIVFLYNFIVPYIIQVDVAVSVVLVQGTLCEADMYSLVYYVPVVMEPEGSSLSPQKPTI